MTYENDIPPAKVLDFLSSQRDLNIAMLNELKRIEAAISGNPAALTPPQAASSPYSTVTIDLTTAKTLYRITIPNPLTFIQFWTDGQFDGIFAFVGTQSAEPIDLSQMSSIPVSQTYQDLFITSDVRQGRSKLVIYFVREANPLQLTMGGQGISLAELAVRNGSINVFDRRGDEVFKDDFSGGLSRWIPNASANSNIVAIGTYYGVNGSGVRLRTGQLLGNYCSLYRYQPFSSLNKHGFEMSVGYQNTLSFTIQVVAYTGAVSYQAVIMFTPPNQLSYQDALGNMINLPVINCNAFQGNIMKLVVDLGKGTYQRLMYNNYYFDLSKISLRVTNPDLGAPAILFLIRSQRIVGASYPENIELSDVIITTNEP